MKRKNETNETGRNVRARTDEGPNIPAQAPALLPSGFAVPQMRPSNNYSAPIVVTQADEDDIEVVADTDFPPNIFGDDNSPDENAMDIDAPNPEISAWNSFADAFYTTKTPKAVPANASYVRVPSNNLMSAPAQLNAVPSVIFNAEQLFEAVSSGNFQQIISCFHNGLNVDSKRPADIDPEGKTALTLAAMSDIPNKMEVIKTLLDLGANPNVTYKLENDAYNENYLKNKSRYDDPLLVGLCRTKGNLEIIKLIFENTKHPIDLNAKYNQHYLAERHRTALDAAVRIGDIELINYLVDQGAQFFDFTKENSGVGFTILRANAINHALKCDVEGSKIAQAMNDHNGVFARYLNENYNEIFKYAVKNDFTKILEWILERGPEIKLGKNKSKNLQGFLADQLTKSMQLQASGSIKVLLAKIKNINATVRGDETPLTQAISMGDMELIKHLVEKLGADVNTFNCQKISPLGKAVQKGDRSIIEYLFAKGAKVNDFDSNKCSALSLAVGKGDRSIIEYLVAKGAKVNAFGYGNSPLAIAARKGDVAIMEYLIANGAKVNALGYGNSPLKCVIEEGNINIVNYLIDNGADVNFAADERGHSPLTLSVSNIDIMQLLIGCGAKINSASTDGTTPLIMAVNIGSAEAVIILLKHGADVNLADARGKTPIMHSFSHWCENKGEIARILIENGADVNAKDVNGNTALSMINYNYIGWPFKYPALMLAAGAIFSTNMVDSIIKNAQYAHLGVKNIKDFFDYAKNNRIPESPTTELSLSPEFVAHYPTEMTKELAFPAAIAASKIFERAGLPYLPAEIFKNEIFKRLSNKDIGAVLCLSSQHDQQSRLLGQGEQRIVPYSLKVAQENVKATYPAKLALAEKSFVNYLEERKAAENAAQGRQ